VTELGRAGWQARRNGVHGDVCAEAAAQSRCAVNAIMAIHPYKHEGLWVFDDARVGLTQEPFVSGADEIIELLASDVPDARGGFTILFSAGPFPGARYELEWRSEETGGNWYYSADADREGWLCPALFKYFDAAPAKIYAQFKPKAR
jgi:hypothetical protein